MNKPKLRAVLIASVLLAFVAAGGWVGYKGRQKIASPRSVAGESEVTVSDEGGVKVVSNNKYGVRVRVPKEWKVISTMPDGEKIQIMKAGPGQPNIDTDWVDGLKLRVYIEDNPRGLNIEDWERNSSAFSAKEFDLLPRLKINGIPIIKSTQYFAAESPFPPSANLDMGFVWQNRHYLFDCEVLGDKSEIGNYLKECENLITTNIALEFK